MRFDFGFLWLMPPFLSAGKLGSRASDPSDSSGGMQNDEVKAGKAYQAIDHGRRLRVRVVSRSEEYPGTWVCQDVDRETRHLHLPAKQLEALRESGC